MKHRIAAHEIRHMLGSEADQFTHANVIDPRFLPGRMSLDPIYRNLKLTRHVLRRQKSCERRQRYLAG